MSRAPRTNIALLTEGQSYIQRAKQARKEQVETVKFDDDARRDWLSGFSKRKKAKTEERRSRAKQREHEAHLEERKKARRELKERAAQNVKAVRKAMGLADDSDVDDDDEDDDVGGNAEAGPSRIMPEEVEYEDEDQLATVTIIEDFEPDQVQRFTRTSSQTPDPETEAGQRVEVTRPKVKVMPASSRRATQKAEREKKKREEQKSSRSMETKAERKIGKAMQSKRRTEKAGLAIERNGKTKFAAKGKGGKGSFKGKKGGAGGKGKR